MNSHSRATQQDGGSFVDVRLRPESVARGLGWLSIALGMAELLAPRAVSRAAGLNDRVGLVRLYGLRELACGIGILASRNPAPFLRARVGGDVLDLATLAATQQTMSERDRHRAMRTAVTVAGISALDVYAARSRKGSASPGLSRVALNEYENRVGFPRAPAEMRGAALADFAVPRDMRTPDALQPYTNSGEHGSSGDGTSSLH
ncbi:MAG: hypothetical protein QOH33_707 [Paraburkholderia sp.]|nr:hypothetical protein [Paraburkholderia sp.]